MRRKIIVSLPVANLKASIAFYKALGFELDPRFSDDSTAGLVWGDSICAMLLTHVKWRAFSGRPFPPTGTCGSMLSLVMANRAEVDSMNRAAAAHGGKADVNPVYDLGFMYNRDLADPDGHVWGAFWMDPATLPTAEQN